MATPFSLDVRETPQTVEIAPRGTIDETADLKVPPLAGRTAVIDGSGVERLNSLGVAAWIKFVDRLGLEGPIVMRRLSPMMITQASMIISFLGRSRVESFFSPWVCPECETSQDLLHGIADPLPDAVPCPKCKAAMELDWDRKAYDSFRAGG